MIRLSAEQIRAFEDMEMHRFIGRIVDELPGYRPEPLAGRSRATLFAAADNAVQRAKVYGIETERGFWLYANIAVTLGAYFDMNPTLPWAAEILGDPSYLGDERMDDLWNASVDWCAAALPEGDYLPSEAFERYLALPPPSAAPQGDVKLLLAQLWPDRAALSTSEETDAFIRHTRERAEDFGLQKPAAIARYTAISYLIGYGFDADPLHDWTRGLPSAQDRGGDLAAADALDAAFRAAHILPALTPEG